MNRKSLKKHLKENMSKGMNYVIDQPIIQQLNGTDKQKLERYVVGIYYNLFLYIIIVYTFLE